MSCTAYLKITDEDARQDAVSQAAAALHIRLVSPGIGGKGAPQLVAAREAVDRRCRATPILELDEAIGGAQLAVPAVAPGSTTAAAGSTAATFTPAQLHAWTLALDPSRTPADTGALVNKARMHVTVALGTATAPTQLPAAFAAMVDACAVDPAEDAVLPFQTTLRNDSAVALDTTLHLKVRDLRDAGAGDPIPVEAATVFADGPSCESLASDETSLHYPRIPPHRDVVQRYVLVLHHFFSPNYDRHGNVYGLRHLVGYISDLFVFVAGGDQSTYIRLNATDCYTGTPHQGVEGLYLDGVEPAFALAIGDFDYATATPDGDELSEPKGQTAC